MNISDRLKYYIENYYSSKSAFADDVGIEQSALSRYLRGDFLPSTKALLSFYKTGISINWLLYGKGNCFNDEIFSIASLNQNLNFQIDNLSICFRRAQDFIIENYGTLEIVAQLSFIDEDELVDLFNNNHIDPKLIRILNKIGCNVIWFYTGLGDKYSDSILGFLLNNSKNDINSNVFKNLSRIEDLYRLIREAIRTEIRNNPKIKGDTDEV